MSLVKIISQIGQGSLASGKWIISTNKWSKIETAFRKYTTHPTGKHTLIYISLHERNGSRGNGIGMGHRNQKGKAK
ncbi:MAG: hypothetical protein GZ091_09855 [Paludibacter sp.]|nr:hypothetical protein [Paludibacter sp.]